MLKQKLGMQNFVLFTSFFSYILSHSLNFVFKLVPSRVWSFIAKLYVFLHLTVFTNTTIRKSFLFFFFILEFYIYMHNWNSFIIDVNLLNMNYVPVTLLVPQKLLITLEKNSCPSDVYTTAAEKTIKRTSKASCQISVLLLDLQRQHLAQLTFSVDLAALSLLSFGIFPGFLLWLFIL